MKNHKNCRNPIYNKIAYLTEEERNTIYSRRNYKPSKSRYPLQMGVTEEEKEIIMNHRAKLYCRKKRSTPEGREAYRKYMRELTRKIKNINPKNYRIIN